MLMLCDAPAGRRARDYEVRRYEPYVVAQTDMEAAGQLNREVLRSGQVGDGGSSRVLVGAGAAGGGGGSKRQAGMRVWSVLHMG